MIRNKVHSIRVYLVGLLLGISTAVVYAQPRLRVPEIYLGLHGGVIASTMQFSPTVDHMSPITQAVVLGGNGGFVFRYSAQKCCGIQVELNYMQRGWQEHHDGGIYTRALHYIELPFLMHIYFGNPSFRGFVNLGPQIGYCVYDGRGSGIKQPSGHQYAPIDKPFDWGVAGGIGCYYRSRKAGLYQLEIRFNYSLGAIFANTATDYFANANPMDLSLNLAWMWEFSPKRTKKHTNTL